MNDHWLSDLGRFETTILYCRRTTYNGLISASFGLFSSSPYDTIQIQIDKSVDGVLGTGTWGGRIESADESTELSQHYYLVIDWSI